MVTDTGFKGKRVYIGVKDRRRGVAVSQRTINKFSGHGNQWTVTPKQLKFVENWLQPDSPTFGNAYQSALAAGFSKTYALKITATSTEVEWISVARRKLTTFNPEHTIRCIQFIAENAPLMRDRLTALGMIGKSQGLFVDRVQHQVEVKFVNNVPRPELNH